MGISLVVLSASSAQIAFYFETGGELKWAQGQNFAHDKAGIKLLLSGSTSICVVAASITLFTAFVAQRLYNSTWSLICSASVAFIGRAPHSSIIGSTISDEPRAAGNSLDYELVSSQEEGLIDISNAITEAESAPFVEKFPTPAKRSRWLPRLKFIAPMIVVVILLIVRPKQFPYPHLSNSIPYTLLEVWTGRADGLCQGKTEGNHIFPFPEQLDKQFWQTPSGKYPGWQPGLEWTTEPGDEYPGWL